MFDLALASFRLLTTLMLLRMFAKLLPIMTRILLSVLGGSKSLKQRRKKPLLLLLLHPLVVRILLLVLNLFFRCQPTQPVLQQQSLSHPASMSVGTLKVLPRLHLYPCQSSLSVL